MNKKLMRSRTDVELSGVCSGMAKYFDIDVSIVRVLWVISALLGGAGLGVYIIFAIIIPKEPIEVEVDDRYEEYDEDFKKDDTTRDERNKTYLAIGLIFVGIMIGFERIVPDGAFQYIWPVALIGGGVLLLSRKKSEADDE